MTESKKCALNDRINVAIANGSFNERDEVRYLVAYEIINSRWLGALPRFTDGFVVDYLRHRALKKQRRMDKFRKMSQRFLMA